MNDQYSDPFPAPIVTREEFGAALRWLRRRHAANHGHPELSLREIAARIRGCVHNTVRNYLAGSTLPSTLALQRLLIVFEATDEQRSLLVQAHHDLAGSRTVTVSALTGPPGYIDTGALLHLRNDVSRR